MIRDESINRLILEKNALETTAFKFRTKNECMNPWNVISIIKKTKYSLTGWTKFL